MIQLITQSIVELFSKLFDFLSNKRVSKIGDKVRSFALDISELETDSAFNKLLKQHQGESGFYLLDNNIDAFIARLMLIEQAQHTIDLQYYAFHADTSGKLIVNELVKAAGRGVRVRVLLDDIDTLGADEAIRMLNAHPLISIRIFNPFVFRGLLRYLEFLVDLSRVGRRMHNKSMIADNRQAIVGGRNISDVYFSADPERLFLDVDLLAVGNIVQDISNSYDDYWNSDWAVPVDFLYEKPRRSDALQKIQHVLHLHEQQIEQIDYLKTVQESRFRQKNMQPETLDFIWSRAQVMYDAPEKMNFTNSAQNTSAGSIENILEKIFSRVQSELTIVSPYFVPGELGMQRFKTLIDKGVKITVLTNSLAATDVVAVHAGYRRYRKRLLETGVEIYELKASAYVRERKHFKILKPGSRASLHAKTYIVDGREVFIGSPNLDPRSIELNTEMGLLIESEILAGEFHSKFSDVVRQHDCYQLELQSGQKGQSKLIWKSVENDRLTQYRREPDTHVLRRLKVHLFSLLPFENLL